MYLHIYIGMGLLLWLTSCPGGLVEDLTQHLVFHLLSLLPLLLSRRRTLLTPLIPTLQHNNQ